MGNVIEPRWLLWDECGNDIIPRSFVQWLAAWGWRP